MADASALNFACLQLWKASGCLFVFGRAAQGEDLEIHRDKPILDHFQLLGGAIREIDDPPSVQVATIGDAHHD
jgi:hypothetical protein